MSRIVVFIGTIDNPNIDETLPVSIVKQGQDTKFLHFRKWKPISLNQNEFDVVSNLVSQGILRVAILNGVAAVWDSNSATPHDKTAVITHNIGNTNYRVILDNSNYEAVNLTTNSFEIKLKDNGTSANNDITFSVFSL